MERCMENDSMLKIEIKVENQINVVCVGVCAGVRMCAGVGPM
jgi:hypothetical protein